LPRYVLRVSAVYFRRETTKWQSSGFETAMSKDWQKAKVCRKMHHISFCVVKSMSIAVVPVNPVGRGR